MADTKKNYYEILGLKNDAGEEEIKAAYKKLVKQYHPDLHPGDAVAAEKFKEINEANEILSDKQKRAAYDFELNRPKGMPNMGNMGGAGGFGGFSDIFESMFQGFSNAAAGGAGAAGAQQAATTGEDIQTEMTLSFMDAAKGCTKEFTYTRNEPCAACRGTGAKFGTAMRMCLKCGGKGQIRVTQDTMFGRTGRMGICPECNGKGKVVTDKCPDCKGKGYARKETKISVTIPAGVDNSSYMKKKGFGKASTLGGQPGDLIIAFKIEPHKIFTRKNMDLYVDLPIPYMTAALGGTVKVPDLDNAFEYPIPEGTQSGTVFTVRGKGIKTKTGAGSLFIRVLVEVPMKVKHEKKLMEEALKNFDVKNYDKAKKYADNMSALYGVNPYNHKK